MATKPTRARKPTKKSSGKRKASSKRVPRKSHLFSVSTPKKTDFKPGLRRYARYRDLGMAKATHGMVQAHVIRMIPPYIAKEVATPHYHDVEFQMIYVLKGWYKTAFEGHGTHTFRKGACWIQPQKIKHTVLGYSKDCELLEIILPAEFDTVTLPG